MPKTKYAEFKKDSVNLISSQKYLDDDVVAQKLLNNDFEVSVSPVFEVDGEKMSVVLDGHHSFAAAKKKGVDPILQIADDSILDYVDDLKDDIDMFLEKAYIDSEYYYIEGGGTVW